MGLEMRPSLFIGCWNFGAWGRIRSVHGVQTVHELTEENLSKHDDVIKWKHFPRHWPFVRGIHPRYWPSVRGIHRSPVNSGWVNNLEAGNLRRHLAHYDVIVMKSPGQQRPRSLVLREPGDFRQWAHRGHINWRIYASVDMPSLVQIIASPCSAPSHYLNPC